jgi:hypothetical protein
MSGEPLHEIFFLGARSLNLRRNSLERTGLFLCAVNGSEMPKGVEHIAGYISWQRNTYVNGSEMPKGVEH